MSGGGEADTGCMITILIALCLGLGAWAGGCAVSRSYKDSAEIQGHAEYYLGPETRRREWRWLPTEIKPEIDEEPEL